VRKRILSSLGYSGLGLTTSFLIILLIYPPYTSTRVLLPIYGLGLFFGALFGLYKGKANAGGYAFILSVVCKTPSVRGGEWVRFKYSEDAENNNLVTAEWLDNLLGLVCKVAPESGRIGGSGRVNRPVRVRLPATGCQMNSHKTPP